MKKSLLIFGIMIGIFCILFNYIINNQTRVIYKYIPRSFDEEQENPVYASDIFKTMFTQPGTWNYGLVDYENRDAESPNKYYISQL
jgi:hypothetical protein